MEIWKDIKGYEGLYQVSNLGRVKSLHFNKEKILKPFTRRYNYLRVILCKNNKLNTYLVHRLVSQAFIPNPNNLPQVNHKDENPLNNNVENLEFCDSKYNSNYGNRNKKLSETKSIKINQFDLNGNYIKTFNSINEAQKEYNVFNICKCCKGKYKTAGGYIWKYSIGGKYDL